MSSKVYVGNLPYDVIQNDLEKLFSECGTVKSIRVIMDRETGKARGFAFVEMKNKEEAKSAIDDLNEKNFRGRPLRVKLAIQDRRN